MTDQKRRRRHHVTRERILSAATELAREEGWPGVTMRKIADRIDYSHPALYAYFATKEDLLLALLREGLALFQAELRAAAETAPSPEGAVRALAATLWDFPWSHPELYQVMHGLGGVAFATADTRAQGREAAAPAIAVVGPLLARHGRDAGDAEREVLLCWATIHGLVTLTMAGRFTRDEGAELARQAGRNALAAWTGRPATLDRDGDVSS